MIDANEAWDSLRVNARKAMSCKLTYKSLVRGRIYEIIDVDENEISIRRISGGEDDTLTKQNVIKAVNWFNSRKCRVRRRKLISLSVAKETAFVLLCSFLCWDDTGSYIVES